MSRETPAMTTASPISCPACGEVCTDYVLGYRCACGWCQDRCEKCEAMMTWYPDHRATTCGGLAIVGARACVGCGVFEVCRHSRPADAVEWIVAKGGRSLTAGGIKIRAEVSNGGDVEAVIARIARLPALEIEVADLRAELLKRRGNP